MEESQPLVGQILNDTYKVQRLLGKGGMGAVYEAENVRLGKKLAVKVLSNLARDDASVVHRFRREAKIATDLGHPHIVDVVDFNQTEDGTPYMVMELLQGEDLQALLDRKNSLPVERVAFIVRQICSALHAAHAKGIVHRDLKPANVFLCNNKAFEDFVVLLDFGISKILGSSSLETRTGFVIGTPQFMSPEQAEGCPDAIGPHTDIFALGAIMYRGLTGSMPFTADTAPGLLYKIVHVEPPVPQEVRPAIPRGISDIVIKALAKKASDRFPSARSLSTALLAAVPSASGPVSGKTWEEVSEGLDAADALALDATLPPAPIGAVSPVEESPSQVEAPAANPGLASTFSHAASEWVTGGAAASRRRPWLVAGGVGVAVLGAVAILLALGERGSVSTHQVAGTPDATGLEDAPRPKASPDATSAPDTAAAATGQVKISFAGLPPGARLVDHRTGDLLGTAAAPLRLPLSRQPRRIRVQCKGYRSTVIRVVPDRDKRVDVKLRRRPVGEGDLPENPFPGSP